MSIPAFLGGPGRTQKKLWIREVRNYHKWEMLRFPDDPIFSHPRKITEFWDWY
jgi:hypothetical protein